jgi:hypothetical protein
MRGVRLSASVSACDPFDAIWAPRAEWMAAYFALGWEEQSAQVRYSFGVHASAVVLDIFRRYRKN